MKTKLSRFNLKKLIFSFFSLVSLIVAAPVYSDTTTQWNVAAEKFKFTQKNVETPSTSASAKVIPQLILEQLAQNLTRLPRAQEQLDRKLYEMRKSRLDLFLQLSKEVQTRDALVLNNYSKSVLDSKIKEEDKKIQEIEQKIQKNLEETEKIKSDFQKEIESDRQRQENLNNENYVEETKKSNEMVNFLKSFIPGNTSTVKLENVALYGNDFTKLFDAGSEKSSQGYESYAFEKACVDSRINGLLTGKITFYGSYISVATTLYQYPGAKIIGNAVEVGSVDELRSIAVSISNQLTPKIADSMPIEVSFDIQPEEAANEVIVTIDDVVYRGNPGKVIIHGGIHTVHFASDGFLEMGTSFNFEGARDFVVNVVMLPDEPGLASLTFKSPVKGTVFANGTEMDSVDEIKRTATIKINNKSILGHFIDLDGKSSDFYIREKYLNNDSQLFVNTVPLERGAYIDSRRKWMYGGYSALIVTLIPTFYIYGNYFNSAAAYNSNKIGREVANGWQTANYISTGISIAAGAFFVYELVRYLLAANSVLPAEVKTITEKQQISIHEQIEEAKIKKQEQEALQQEMENKKSEENPEETESKSEESENQVKIEEN